MNKAGTGTLVLSGTNDYQGGTDIKAGILQISDDTNLGIATEPSRLTVKPNCSSARA
ncbi:hypothetical protein HED54_03855 [Ochrobactrum anthropi ATCC 49188]|nr:hypothetical protein [Brucella anthropi ATCC 49188]